MTLRAKLLPVLLLLSLTANIAFLWTAYVNSGPEAYQIAKADGTTYLEEYDPYIRDAERRWRELNPSTDDPFFNRVTSVMTFSDRVCVSFEFGARMIGGAPPVFCYRPLTTELVYSFDGGE